VIGDRNLYIWHHPDQDGTIQFDDLYAEEAELLFREAVAKGDLDKLGNLLSRVKEDQLGPFLREGDIQLLRLLFDLDLDHFPEKERFASMIALALDRMPPDTPQDRIHILRNFWHLLTLMPNPPRAQHLLATSL
jgi:hypothetical protein